MKFVSIVNAMRIASVICGLIYLLLGWIWAYWLALAVLPFGILGLYLLKRTAGTARQIDGKSTPSERTMERVALWINLSAFAVSFGALIVTLAYN